MPIAIDALLIVIGLSALGGWLLIVGKEAEKPVKAMMFVAYFWMLAFSQLLLLAAGYYIWKHY